MVNRDSVTPKDKMKKGSPGCVLVFPKPEVVSRLEQKKSSQICHEWIRLMGGVEGKCSHSIGVADI